MSQAEDDPFMHGGSELRAVFSLIFLQAFVSTSGSIPLLAKELSIGPVNKKTLMIIWKMSILKKNPKAFLTQYPQRNVQLQAEIVLYETKLNVNYCDLTLFHSHGHFMCPFLSITQV